MPVCNKQITHQLPATPQRAIDVVKKVFAANPGMHPYNQYELLLLAIYFEENGIDVEEAFAKVRNNAGVACPYDIAAANGVEINSDDRIIPLSK